MTPPTGTTLHTLTADMIRCTHRAFRRGTLATDALDPTSLTCLSQGYLAERPGVE
jgi:hypothetical protein